MRGIFFVIKAMIIILRFNPAYAGNMKQPKIT